MDVATVIASQYNAALEMLHQAVVRCPDALWDDPADKTKFWHIAYHALFYTHLYLQDSEQSFTPWPGFRDEYHFMGPIPWEDNRLPNIGAAYDRASILEFLAFCRQQVTDRAPLLDMSGPSGFSWLPFGKLELQIYSIRHLQQHAGELMERLGGRAGVDVDWVGAWGGERQPDA